MRGNMSATTLSLEPSVSGEKVAMFFLATVVIGVFQLWVIVLVLLAMKKTPDIDVLLGDGGLFFFTTSLLATSGLKLFEKQATDRRDIICSVVVGLVVFVPAIVFYSVVMAMHFNHPSVEGSPFAGMVWPQFGCGFVAVAYAVYVAVRTGMFRE